MKEREMALNNMIYKIRSGSQLYGTVTDNSDTDFMGIFIPDKDYVMGINKCDQVNLSEKVSTTIKNQKEDVDYILYSLPKFIHLAIGNNPNILELFFVNPNCVLFENEFAKRLKNCYSLFVSKKSYHTFKGYSYTQRKKLTIKRANMTGRTELVAKHGYDTKFASHLIRLLLEGQQILNEGKITLPLPQNNLVRDIKLGQYSLEWVLNKAEEFEHLVDLAYSNSKLQHSADLKNINKLQIKLLEDYWSKR